MELFAQNDEVQTLEASLPTLEAEPHLEALVSLAWHLRQRDCERAQILASQADAILKQITSPRPDHRRMTARLLLVRGEVRLLFADLTTAHQLAQSALSIFENLADHTGLGDAHWLEASILADRRAGDEVGDSINRAIAEYRLAKDSLRINLAIARQYLFAAFRYPGATATEIANTFDEDANYPDALVSWLAFSRAIVAALTDAPGTAIKFFLKAYQAAHNSGQTRQAIVSANNASESFATLGDLDAALEWAEDALAMARRTKWPPSIGVCQMQLGDIMRQLGRHEEARTNLQEALKLMATLIRSRNYELTLANLGQFELDTGNYAAALDWFLKLESCVKSHREPDLLIKSWGGQAGALLHLGRPQEALKKANAALSLASEHSNAYGQMHVLSILAQMHIEHPLLPAPEDMSAPSAALHYLNQAVETAASMAGYQLSPELLKQLANAYAFCGDYHQAYEQSMAAFLAQNKSRHEEAQKRVLAMQIRQQMDNVRAETEHHRQLAATLKETSATLEILGTIGREITASLNAHAVFSALERHVNQLLDATSFAIYLLDPDQKSLSTSFGIEAGVPLPIRTIPIDSPISRFARCARDRQEIVVNLEPGNDPNLVPGTMATLSLLLSPLMIGERLLGVMTIQSPRQNAYGERERSIFRALCAYGAIALDNAAAYTAAESAQRKADAALHELQQAQTQLVEQNKLLEQLALTDQLTGLNNRLRLDQTLEEERLRHTRHGANFCVLLLDVDKFKSVNDTYGHQTGDQVLINIARIMRDTIREVDMLGRWGGEEFLIICRESTLEGASILAEKLRVAIHAHPFEKLGSLSASFGVAMFRTGETVSDTIARADLALYRAKQTGRNRVCQEA